MKRYWLYGVLGVLVLFLVIYIDSSKENSEFSPYTSSSPTPVPTGGATSSSTPSVLEGDVNGDGKSDVKDIFNVLKDNNFPLLEGGDDINEDADIDEKDLSEYAKRLLGENLPTTNEDCPECPPVFDVHKCLEIENSDLWFESEDKGLLPTECPEDAEVWSLCRLIEDSENIANEAACADDEECTYFSVLYDDCEVIKIVIFVDSRSRFERLGLYPLYFIFYDDDGNRIGMEFVGYVTSGEATTLDGDWTYAFRILYDWKDYACYAPVCEGPDV